MELNLSELNTSDKCISSYDLDSSAFTTKLKKIKLLIKFWQKFLEKGTAKNSNIVTDSLKHLGGIKVRNNMKKLPTPWFEHGTFRSSVECSPN